MKIYYTNQERPYKIETCCPPLLIDIIGESSRVYIHAGQLTIKEMEIKHCYYCGEKVEFIKDNNFDGVKKRIKRSLREE